MKIVLEVTDDEYWALHAMMFQAYNIFTDADEYYEKRLSAYTEEFRRENRKVVVELIKKLGWPDPQKPMKVH